MYTCISLCNFYEGLFKNDVAQYKALAFSKLGQVLKKQVLGFEFHVFFGFSYMLGENIKIYKNPFTWLFLVGRGLHKWYVLCNYSHNDIHFLT